ncbi:MAG: hypothetical protein R6X03_10195 [Methyloceanibacter sp.]|jgi:hypothetical protein
MIKPILAATVLCFGLASAAHAVPIKPSASPSVALTSDLVEVGKKSYKGKGKYKGSKYRGHKAYRGKYRAGRKYSYAPRGWRSYSYRPYGWYGRGCVIVGPLWFCP